METIKLVTRVGADGVLKVETPVSVRNANCDVIIVYTVRPTSPQEDWEAFVNATYGSLADDPLVRPEQLPLETRDAIE